MKYTVIWLPDAETELARLYNAASNKNELSRAADMLDAALVRLPLAIGESRSDQTRIAVELPLAIEYEVREADRVVQVNSVWRFVHNSR
jgi:hypothetical protein